MDNSKKKKRYLPVEGLSRLPSIGVRHSAEPHGVFAGKAKLSWSDITTKRGSSLPRIFHDRNGSGTQDSRLCLQFLVTLHHPSGLGCSKHGVLVGRTAVCCSRWTSSAMNAKGVARGCRTKLAATGNSSHSRVDFEGVVFVRLPVVVAI